MSSGIFSDVPERFKESISRFPANFKEISESQFLTYHVTRSPIWLKLAILKTCSDLLNMGRFCWVLMPVASSDPSKFCDDWPYKSR